MKKNPAWLLSLGGLFLMQTLSALAGDIPDRQTFCNPMNLDYGPYARGGRHGADPVIVLFKNKYYLFDSWDKPGYRMSDDLIHWTVVPFDLAILPLAADMKNNAIVAPAGRPTGSISTILILARTTSCGPPIRPRANGKSMRR
jgi:hypothetical protein